MNKENNTLSLDSFRHLLPVISQSLAAFALEINRTDVAPLVLRVVHELVLVFPIFERNLVSFLVLDVLALKVSLYFLQADSGLPVSTEIMASLKIEQSLLTDGLVLADWLRVFT